MQDLVDLAEKHRDPLMRVNLRKCIRPVSIEPGKLADLAVLSDDPLTCDEDDIAGIVAHVTIVGGQIVYDRSKSTL